MVTFTVLVGIIQIYVVTLYLLVLGEALFEGFGHTLVVLSWNFPFLSLPIFCQSIKKKYFPIVEETGNNSQGEFTKVRLGKFQSQRSTAPSHQCVSALVPALEICRFMFTQEGCGAARKSSERNLSSVIVLSGASSDKTQSVFVFSSTP